jgi:predicted ester cyclase
MKSTRMGTGICLLIGFAFIQGFANAQSPTSQKKESTMSTIQKNKAVIQQLYEQSLNNRNLELLKQFVSDEYVNPQGQKGAAGFSSVLMLLVKAFPDVHWTIDNLVGEGDKVAVSWQWKGTNTAPYRNFDVTGKVVTNDGVAIYELKDGKIINVSMQTDRLGFLQAINVLPQDLTAPVNKMLQKDRVQFIDKFFVPAAAKNEFYERTRFNRKFIRTLPGFIEDAMYEYTDDKGNLICVTIAQWANMEAMNKAKEAVQAEYKKQGIDIPGMMQRLHITVDRGLYKATEEQR